MDPKLPNNQAAMIIQAQERKNLVNKLINMRSHVDKSEPKSYTHLSSGRINRRNDEVRKINADNQKMLKKIMGIMNRKPVSNGLNGVALKKQNSIEDYDEDAEDSQERYDTFEGNEDIRLVQSNVDAVMQQQKFSFEINPATSQPKISGNPFTTDTQNQRQSTDAVYDTQPLSPDTSGVAATHAESTQANMMVLASSKEDVSGEQKIEDQQMIMVGSESTGQYERGIESSTMFDKNLPLTESENKIPFYPMGGKTQDSSLKEIAEPDALTFQQSSRQQKVSIQPKRLYPGQVTLNHTVRKKEVQRINRENMVMLKALRDIKPVVERKSDQAKHFVQMEAYKRNMRKFRNVGQSQPRPRVQQLGPASEALPDIHRGSTNQSEMQGLRTAFEKQAIGARRTSQGNRNYILNPERQQSVPGSQRVNYRNNRNGFNSNPSQTNDYTGNVSTRQATTNGDEEGEQITELNQLDAITVYPVGYGNAYGTQATLPSTDSTIKDSEGMKARRPSYLQKLKHSPLLTSMTHHQKIPKSIINRVITRKEQEQRGVFRKYGTVLRNETHGFPQHLYRKPAPLPSAQNRELSQNSIVAKLSNRGSKNDVSASELSKKKSQQSSGSKAGIGLKIGNKNESPTKISSKDSQPAITAPTAEVGSFELVQETQDGASLIIEDQHQIPNVINTSSQPVIEKKESIVTITEENNAVHDQIEIKDQEETVAEAENSKQEDPYSDYTPVDSIVPSSSLKDQKPSISEKASEQLSGVLSQNASESLAGSIKPNTSKGLHGIDDEPTPGFQVPNGLGKNSQASAMSLEPTSNLENALLSQSKKQIDAHVTSPEGGAMTRNNAQLATKSIPVTEGSKYSIQEDTALKNQDDDTNGKDQYSIPAVSQEASVDGYSNEDFDDETKSPERKGKKQPETQGVTPTALSYESQSLDYISDEKASNEPKEAPVDRQTTNQIEMESNLVTQNTGFQHQATFDISENLGTQNSGIQRQRTDQIEEQSFAPVDKFGGNGSLVSLPEANIEDDTVSDSKTISPSKSQTAQNYAIQSKPESSHQSTKLMTTKPKIGKTPTQQEITVAGLIESRGTPEMLTHGTGFSQGKTSGVIQQSKENIILSELSSKNNPQ